MVSDTVIGILFFKTAEMPQITKITCDKSPFQKSKWRPWTGSTYITLVSSVVYVIATKFQRLRPCFRGLATRLEYSQEWPMFGSVGNQRWLPITGSRYKLSHISASIHDRNEIPTAILMFSRSGNMTRVLTRMTDVRISRKSKMLPLTGSGYKISHISASIHDKNEIPTAMPIF